MRHVHQLQLPAGIGFRDMPIGDRLSTVTDGVGHLSMGIVDSDTSGINEDGLHWPTKSMS